MAHAYNPNYLGGSDWAVQGQPRQIVQETLPSPKLTRTKWTGGMAQVVQHLLCKHNALSSNPVLKKKNEEFFKSRLRQKDQEFS
jgi:hypothetical protein